MNNEMNRLAEGKFGVEMIWGGKHCSENVFDKADDAKAVCEKKAMLIDEMVSSGAWLEEMGNIYITYYDGLTPQYCHKWMIDEDRQYEYEDFTA